MIKFCPWRISLRCQAIRMVSKAGTKQARSWKILENLIYLAKYWAILGTYIALHSLVSWLADHTMSGDGHVQWWLANASWWLWLQWLWSGLGSGLGSMPCVITLGWHTVPPGWAG